MKSSPPGIINPEGGVYLWGGDNNARDVFSRVVYGSQIVLVIAPAATLPCSWCSTTSPFASLMLRRIPEPCDPVIAAGCRRLHGGIRIDHLHLEERTS